MAYTDLPVGSTINAGVITIPVGDVAIGAGNLKLRVKALNGSNAGNVLTNPVAFTVAGGGGGAIAESRYLIMHNVEPANITTTTKGADTVVLTVANIAPNAPANTYLENGLNLEPLLVPNAFNGKPAIEIRRGDALSSKNAVPLVRPTTVIYTMRLMSTPTGVVEYMNGESSLSMGFYGLKPFIGSGAASILLSPDDIAVGTPFVMLAEYNPDGQGKLFINGVLKIEGEVGTIAGSTQIRLFDGPSTSPHFQITDIRVIQEALPLAEKQAVSTELMTKYGIV